MKSLYAVVIAVCLALLLHFSHEHFSTTGRTPQPEAIPTEILPSTVTPAVSSSDSTSPAIPVDSSQQESEGGDSIDDLFRNSGSSLIAPYSGQGPS
ncbi:MAG: hypothetical protein AAGG75_26080 [Bacteroidota bacterium]